MVLANLFFSGKYVLRFLNLDYITAKTDPYRLFFLWTLRAIKRAAVLWPPQRRGGLDTQIRTVRRDWRGLLFMMLQVWAASVCYILEETLKG